MKSSSSSNSQYIVDMAVDEEPLATSVRMQAARSRVRGEEEKKNEEKNEREREGREKERGELVDIVGTSAAPHVVGRTTASRSPTLCGGAPCAALPYVLLPLSHGEASNGWFCGAPSVQELFATNAKPPSALAVAASCSVLSLAVRLCGLRLGHRLGHRVGHRVTSPFAPDGELIGRVGAAEPCKQHREVPSSGNGPQATGTCCKALSEDSERLALASTGARGPPAGTGVALLEEDRRTSHTDTCRTDIVVARAGAVS